jgi:hypothetical protein
MTIMNEAIAEYQASHPWTPAPVREARDPLLDEALFDVYGYGRDPGSLYYVAVNAAASIYSWGCQLQS